MCFIAEIVGDSELESTRIASIYCSHQVTLIKLIKLGHPFWPPASCNLSDLSVNNLSICLKLRLGQGIQVGTSSEVSVFPRYKITPADRRVYELVPDPLSKSCA